MEPRHDPLSDERRVAFRAAQATMLAESLPQSLAVTVAIAAALFALLFDVVRPEPLFAWFALLLAVTGWRAALLLRFRSRPADRSAADSLTPLRIGCALAGAAWGAAAMLAHPVGLQAQLLMVCVVGGTCSAAVVSLYVDRRSAWLFVGFSAVPFALQLLVSVEPAARGVGWLALLYIGVLASLASQGERRALETFLLRAEANEQRQSAETRARVDALTGLPNAVSAQEQIDAAIDAARQRAAGGAPEPFALILLQVREFDRIVASLGHAAGDAALRQIAGMLCARVGDPQCVARVGAARFLIRLPQALDLARFLAKQLQAGLRAGLGDGPVPLSLDSNAGICVWPEHGADASELLCRLETALLDAREQRVPVMAYKPGREDQLRRQLELLGDLPRALLSNEIELYYQPRVDLRTLEVRGLEALIRWTHPRLGAIPPAEFIVPAERTGAIGVLTAWVLRNAIDQLRHWRDAGFDPDVSVNLSAFDLQDAELPDTLVEALRRANVPGSRLILEVTETAVMSDPEHAAQVMQHLAHYGVRFSIDDFGTGYSSLAQLKRLPVDELKIDRSFIAGLDHEGDDAFIVASTIELGHKLGLHVTAEGVESEATLRQLHDLGCDYAQGYAIARPLPAARVREVVASLNTRAECDATSTQVIRSLVRRAAGDDSRQS